VHIWRVSLNPDYDPVCGIRKISNSGRKKDRSEVAKYTLKDSEFAAENDALTGRLVGVYDKALRNRPLCFRRRHEANRPRGYDRLRLNRPGRL
jgi:hypothetical protein